MSTRLITLYSAKNGALTPDASRDVGEYVAYVVASGIGEAIQHAKQGRFVTRKDDGWLSHGYLMAYSKESQTYAMATCHCDLRTPFLRVGMSMPEIRAAVGAHEANCKTGPRRISTPATQGAAPEEPRC